MGVTYVCSQFALGAGREITVGACDVKVAVEMGLEMESGRS